MTAVHPVTRPEPQPHEHVTPAGSAGGDQARRRELAAFLRSRRERLSPEHVGMPHTGRRRTPGLRREEVAAVAGVGVTWYTWLEQARPVTPSPQVVDAIGRALLLDEHERTHLFILAGITPVRAPRTLPVVDPAVELLLRTVEPFPAVVMNARYDILAYNTAYRFVISDLDLVPPDERNALWLLITHPDWIAASVDRSNGLRRLVGQFRAAMAEHMTEPAWRCLLHRLRTTSQEFAEIWDRHEVRYPESMVKTVLSRRVGPVRCHLTHLWLDQDLSRRMSLYTPVDDASRHALDRLMTLVGQEEDARTVLPTLR